jgi:SAM-dependent methyltransferase
MTDPFARHAEDVESALASGDAEEIKATYRRLGDYLEESAAGGGDVPVLAFPETAAIVVAQVPAGARRVLDAGCGPNPLAAISLAGDGHEVVAVDIGLGTARLARSTSAAAGVSVLPVVADVEALPFRAGAFDALVCDDTIEHLPDDRRGAAELARVLVRSGVAVVATPNRHSAEIIARKLSDRVRGRFRPRRAYFVVDSHLREYTPGELQRVLSPSLRVERRVPVGWPPRGPRRARVNRMVHWPVLDRLSRMVVVVARPDPNSRK